MRAWGLKRAGLTTPPRAVRLRVRGPGSAGRRRSPARRRVAGLGGHGALRPSRLSQRQAGSCGTASGAAARDVTATPRYAARETLPLPRPRRAAAASPPTAAAVAAAATAVGRRARSRRAVRAAQAVRHPRRSGRSGRKPDGARVRRGPRRPGRPGPRDRRLDRADRRRQGDAGRHGGFRHRHARFPRGQRQIPARLAEAGPAGRAARARNDRGRGVERRQVAERPRRQVGQLRRPRRHDRDQRQASVLPPRRERRTRSTSR